MKKRYFYILFSVIFLISVLTFSYKLSTYPNTSLKNSSNTGADYESSSSESAYSSSDLQSDLLSSSISEVFSSTQNATSTVKTSTAKVSKTISNNTTPKTQWGQSGAVPSPVSVPNLDGQVVSESDRVYIDLSYTSYGFVKVRLKSSAGKRIKVIIKHGETEYRYDLNTDGNFESFPLQTGNGEYTISVYENIVDQQYSYLHGATANVSLIRDNITFLVPCQIVNYGNSSYSTALAKQLVAGDSNNYGRISSVLSYIAKNITYDYNLAKTVKSGYIPNVEHTLSVKKGICYDYAAVSAAMLRSLGYPTKLITGYVAPNSLYHAWVEVYIEGKGFIKVMEVTVNTSNWSRVDVTFISNADSVSEISKYVNNGSNYTKRYTY